MDIKEALKVAIKGEIEGRELYKVLAEKTDDPEAKIIFENLAKEEDSHFQALKTVSQTLVDSEEFVMPKLEKLVTFENVDSPIFSKSFKTRVKEKHFEMSALSIAMKLELDSTNFYKKMADEAPNNDLKIFFQTLSDWEKGHYDAISKQIKALEDEYFEKNNFAPF